MFFKKKEDKSKLPKLPTPKTPFNVKQSIAPPHEEEDVIDSHALPSFPDSPSHNNFSQAAIKDAVGINNSEKNFPEPPPEEFKRNKTKTVEMKEWHPSTPENHGEAFPIPHTSSRTQTFPEEEMRTIAPPSQKEMPTREYHQSTTAANTDVFVRIDKFHSAKKSLGNAQEKLEEIEELIKKIRETKTREDQELSSWEQDILHVKSQIKDVSENVFEKVE